MLALTMTGYKSEVLVRVLGDRESASPAGSASPPGQAQPCLCGHEPDQAPAGRCVSGQLQR